MQRTWAVQIIKGITRNNFVKFIFSSSSKDSSRPPCPDSLPACVCDCGCVCVSNWENRNEFSVTSVSVSQTIEPDRTAGGCERVRWNGCGMWHIPDTRAHALYMPATFYPLLPLGIRTGILSD